MDGDARFVGEYAEPTTTRPNAAGGAVRVQDLLGGKPGTLANTDLDVDANDQESEGPMDPFRLRGYLGGSSVGSLSEYTGHTKTAKRMR